MNLSVIVHIFDLKVMFWLYCRLFTIFNFLLINQIDQKPSEWKRKSYCDIYHGKNLILSLQKYDNNDDDGRHHYTHTINSHILATFQSPKVSIFSQFVMSLVKHRLKTGWKMMSLNDLKRKKYPTARMQG